MSIPLRMLAICAYLMHADRRDGMFTRGPAWCEAATVRRAWQRSRWCGEGWGGDEESEVGGKYGSQNGREYCADDLAADVLASLFLSLLLLIYLRCHPLSACTGLRLELSRCGPGTTSSVWCLSIQLLEMRPCTVQHFMRSWMVMTGFLSSNSERSAIGGSLRNIT